MKQKNAGKKCSFTINLLLGPSMLRNLLFFFTRDDIRRSIQKKAEGIPLDPHVFWMKNSPAKQTSSTLLSTALVRNSQPR